MCNNLHRDSKPIKEEGFGWKIFGFGDFYTTCFSPRIYKHKKDGWIVWNLTDPDYNNFGFTFFLTRKEARHMLKALRNINPECEKHSIRRIEYKKGMGKHTEEFMLRGEKPIIALCKAFKIIE
jgi:hypothetical protein